MHHVGCYVIPVTGAVPESWGLPGLSLQVLSAYARRACASVPGSSATARCQACRVRAWPGPPAGAQEPG